MRIPLLALVLLTGLPVHAQVTRRIAVIVGNDVGGDGTQPLLYAVEDAKKIRGVLTRLGGVREEDAVLVLNRNAEALIAALGEAERKSEAARSRGERTALIVYFSGHAKDGALRLNQTRLPFDLLKSRLAQAPADIRIGIFDSCRSGTLTRTKGARRAPEFEIQSDQGRDAQGMVLLTSSTSDEDSQESDALGGSYFTHHLASGLMGDADRSRDGRVTLAEAYAYAYDRTVADTLGSAAGAQHPTFSYDLAGNGDLVITDVVTRSEGLEFAAAAPGGLWYLVDDHGFVVAEVNKQPEQARRIALPPGRYWVRRRLEDRLRIGQVQVVGGRVERVDDTVLRDAPFSDDPVKGGRLVNPPPRFSWAVTFGYQSFFDRAARRELFPATGLLSVELLQDRFLLPQLRLGIDFSFGGTDARLQLGALNLAYQFTELNLGGTLLYEFGDGPVVPFVGARAAAIIMSRAFEEGNVSRQSLLTVSPGVVAGVQWKLTSTWGLQARGRGHYFFYGLEGPDQPRHLGFWELGAMVTYAL